MKKTLNLSIVIILFSLNLSCSKNKTIQPYWTATTKGKVTRVLFTFKNYVYVSAGDYIAFGSPNYMIYCIDIKSGMPKWIYNAGEGLILEKISMDNGKIFIKDKNGKIVWLDALKGTKLVGFNGNEPPEVRLNHTYNSNIVKAYPGNEEKKIPAKIASIDQEGNILWSVKIKPIKNVKKPYIVNFSFLINKNKLIVALYNGKVKCYLIE